MKAFSWCNKVWGLVCASALTGVSALVVSSFLGLLMTDPAHAGLNQWTTNGPRDGYIAAVAIDPLTPATLYAGDLGRGVYKSTDAGTSWIPMNSGFPTTFPSIFVRALVIDPLTPTTLYAGTGGPAGSNVVKSTNGGASWIPMNSNLSSTCIDVTALAIDPLTPTTLYAGTNGCGAFKSTDGGANWVAMNDGLTSSGAAALAVDPQTPTTLYAATGSGMFKSTNGGMSWAAAKTGLTNSTLALQHRSVAAVAIDPRTPTTLYAGASALNAGDTGVYKSTNGGTDWTLIFTAPEVTALAIDPLTPTILYASAALGYNRSVYKSTDGGVSWTSMSGADALGEVHALAITPGAPQVLYAGDFGDGVFDFQISGTPPPAIIAMIENPEDGPVSGIAVIRGWAFAPQDSVQIGSVDLFIDGVYSGNVPCCSERADVQAAFPQFPADNTLHSGWGTTFNWGLLSAGMHTVQVRIFNTRGEQFFPEMRTVTVVKPGDFEFLDRFSLSGAIAQIQGEDLVVEGVVVRDKATQQQRALKARFRWFTSSQSLQTVEAVTTATAFSLPSLLATRFASLPAWLTRRLAAASAQATPGIVQFFESPEESQVVSGVAIMRGWAFTDALGASLSEVRLVIDGAPSSTIPCCSQRGDVAAAFPGNPSAVNSGWGITVNYGLLSSGFHTLSVQMADSAGTSVSTSHGVTVVRIGGFEFLDQFNLSGATAQIVQTHPWSGPDSEEIRLEGVQVRDKASQQTRVVTVRLRWFQNTQALGIVASAG